MCVEREFAIFVRPIFNRDMIIVKPLNKDCEGISVDGGELVYCDDVGVIRPALTTEGTVDWLTSCLLLCLPLLNASMMKVVTTMSSAVSKLLYTVLEQFRTDRAFTVFLERLALRL